MDSVPNDMVLLEYIGGNIGTEFWGGAGGTPSGRTYVFGALEQDRVKYVDERDVDWFLARRQNGQVMFKKHDGPAPQPAETSKELAKTETPNASQAPSEAETPNASQAPVLVTHAPNEATPTVVTNAAPSTGDKGSMQSTTETAKEIKSKRG